MNQNYALIRSRTFWTLVVMGALPIINLFVPLLSPTMQAIVEPILGLIATYFHNSTAQTAGATN